MKLVNCKFVHIRNWTSSDAQLSSVKTIGGEEKLRDQFFQLQIEDLDSMIFQLERADDQWKKLGKSKTLLATRNIKS